jgi:hypothetical protein
MFNWMDLQQTMSAKDLDKRYSQTANIGLFVPERPKDQLTCDTEHTIVKLCQGSLLERPSRYWCLVSLCTKAYHILVPSISNVSTTGRPPPRIQGYSLATLSFQFRFHSIYHFVLEGLSSQNIKRHWNLQPQLETYPCNDRGISAN